ncbi:hypothetical protein LOC67_17060 [Stieleria sp. JC731]|uniref:hypothetical protein n=1 Tax=Pirellulaceae TaxID=2691357 RepID=UPI001E4929D1|nr:hypothetical protein [Stieleria sp. JC731]MCC9602266.1 hypothetical protein [Stieleria sp. JC731]
MKLTARLNRILNEHLEGDLSGGWRSVWKVLAEEIDRVNCPDDDILQTIRSKRLPDDCTEDQWLITKFILHSPLDPLNAISDGICRRMWKDSPCELALRLSFSSRHHWMASHLEGHFDELWRPILMAFAAHDTQGVFKLVSLWRGSAEKPNNCAYANICNCLQAIVLDNDDQLRDSIGKLIKGSRPGYISSVCQILRAIQSRDPDEFAAGLNRMLRSYRSYMFGDDIMGLLDPHAIGIFELARQYAPGVLSRFDVDRKLPWDAEYVRWLHSVDDIRDIYEPFDAPDWMQTTLFDMAGTEWALNARDKWRR